MNTVWQIRKEDSDGKGQYFPLLFDDKAVTSVAVMTLVEKGVLSLSDTVSTYLPGFKDQKVLTEKGLVPAKREARLQDLMDMTAGLTYPDASFPAGEKMQEMIDEYYRKIFEEDTPTSTYDLANLIGKQPLEFPSGKDGVTVLC